MRALLFVAIFALAGCDRAAESAEKQFEIVSAKGTAAEKCEAATLAAAEWLKRENAEKYKDWKLTRDIYCLSDKLDRQLGLR